MTRAATRNEPTWGKSAALRWFAARLVSAQVPRSWVVPRARWESDRAACLGEIDAPSADARFAVRSDARLEDQPEASHAGQFLSLLDVPHGALESAIAQVLDTLPGDAQDAALIQPMVTDSTWVGVASTHRVKDGAPWYCVELAESGPTAVTNGRASGRLVALARKSLRAGRIDRLDLASPLPAILTTLLEIEALAADTPLEIEFAVRAGATPTLTLLQVRPLATAARWRKPAASLALPRLAKLRSVDDCSDIVGDRTLLSLMSDWNPAELLGTHPRPLALSLFDLLIGNGVWWNARARLGYKPAPRRRIPLLRPIKGRPYVDVRRSANSMLPRGLDASIERRIVEAWLDRLEQAPELHDKVEFEVFRTARDFTGTSVLQKRWSPVIGTQAQQRWEAQLGDLTRNLMQHSLAARYGSRLAALEASDPRPLGWRELLRQCRGGTEEFAMLARVAFVAEAQLRSAVERGAFTASRARELRQAIASVSSLISPSDHSDIVAAHLRPGTFDITQALRSAPGTPQHRRVLMRAAAFALSSQEHRSLRLLLAEAGFAHEPAEWLDFVMRACRAREWAKFVFTRHLSAALESIAAEFEAHGLDRHTASWLTLSGIAAGAALPAARRAGFWRQLALSAEERHRVDGLCMLSPMLASERDSWIADSLGVVPNFIGDETVSGPLVVLDGAAEATSQLHGATVVLRHADPGYDWLFGHGIRGLITAWGGAHSHMAIRCAEFGLSAAIGCGEAVFRRARRADRVRIDPVQGSIWLS
jgi:hypothetical protein